MQDTHRILDTLQNYNNVKVVPKQTAGKNGLVALSFYINIIIHRKRKNHEECKKPLELPTLRYRDL